MGELLTVEEALASVLERVRPLPDEPVSLAAAAGRVLAAATRAAVDLPPFASSAMDGVALRAADTPGTLPVELRIAAGRPSPRPLRPAEAMGIATGGMVPEGADAVVPVERLVDHGDRVEVPAAAAVGANIRPRGGDIRSGDEIVAAGTALGAAQVGALAAAGVAEVRCTQRPRVAILTTGTELRPPGQSLAAGEIYESNGLMLAAVVRAAGAVVELAATVEDDAGAHRTALERALEADLVVTSGGVSMGQHDLVRAAAASLGAEEVFWGVAMRPGKPLAFAVHGATPVFGLPGNPVSSLVGALLFVRPALLALQGHREPAPRYHTAVLGVAAVRRPQRDEFLRARREDVAGETVLVPVAGQDSHMIARAAPADALVHVPRGEGELERGARVRYLALDSSAGGL